MSGWTAWHGVVYLVAWRSIPCFFLAAFCGLPFLPFRFSPAFLGPGPVSCGRCSRYGRICIGAAGCAGGPPSLPYHSDVPLSSQVYDPQDTGYVDSDVLRGIMSRMGYGELTKEDMEVLVKTADVDGDGKISLDDFRNMLNFNKYPSNDDKAPMGAGLDDQE